MVDIYPKAYKEVYVILQHIPDEDLNKIPIDIIETLKAKMDSGYYFKLNENQDFQEQDVLKETKALLAVFYRDYWATEEQKERIIAKQKYDLDKIEEQKRELYNPDNIFKKKSTIKNKEEFEEKDTDKMLLVVKKESIFIRIINKIKNYFKKY